MCRAALNDSRRRFLARLVSGALALLPGSFLLACSKEQTAGPVVLGALNDFEQPATALELYRVLVIKEAGPGASKYAALSLVCTHQTCLLKQQRGTQHLQCPCHGSEFGARGEVVRGPAVRPLAWYKLTLSADKKLVLHREETVPPDWRLEVSA